MINREEYLNYLIKLKDKKIIKVVTGIRRSGKSTLFKLYKEYLLNNGVDSNQILSINFENPDENNFNDWKELYDYINSNLIENKKNYIFLDEVQILEHFEKAVDGLYLKDNVDLYITGSNSHILSSELSTYLTGRYMEVYILPLSFKEYSIAYPNLSKEELYQKYIECGGFPYLLELDNDISLITNYLSSIYDTIILKDVVSRNNIKDIMVLESVVRFLYGNIGQLVSTKKISDTLNSSNRKTSVNTIESYVNALVNSYMVYKVNRFDVKGKELLRTGSKYYASDLGLRRYLFGSVRDFGSILENIIFLELKRRNYEIFVGKVGDSEIDFIVKNEEGYKYIQVSLSVRDENTLKRELASLESVKDNYPKYLITLDFETVEHNGIKQINALDFLLGNIDI